MPFFIVTAYVLQGLFSNLKPRNDLEHERGDDRHAFNIPAVIGGRVSNVPHVPCLLKSGHPNAVFFFRKNAHGFIFSTNIDFHEVIAPHPDAFFPFWKRSKRQLLA